MKKTKRGILIILTFFVMGMLGFIENIRGSLIPPIKSFYIVDYSAIGYFLFISSLGYIVANFIGGNIVDAIGHRKLFFLGGILTFLGIRGMMMSNRFYIFLLSAALANYGYGTLSIGANTLAPVVFVKNQGILLNLLHFFYGLGATIGPRYVGATLKAKWNWQQAYGGSLIIVLAFLVYLIFCSFPRMSPGEKKDKIPFTKALLNKKVLLFSFILGFYVAAEVGVANWLPNYLQTVKGLDAPKSTIYLSIFFAIFTLGRLIGGFIVEKIGYFRSIIGFLTIALILFIIGALSKGKLLILLSISGFFFSIIYPTTFALLMKEFDKGTSTMIGMVITLSSTTNMLGNSFIGKVNDWFGVTLGFILIPLFLLIVLLLTIILRKATTQKESES